MHNTRIKLNTEVVTTYPLERRNIEDMENIFTLDEIKDCFNKIQLKYKISLVYLFLVVAPTKEDIFRRSEKDRHEYMKEFMRNRDLIEVYYQDQQKKQLQRQEPNKKMDWLEDNTIDDVAEYFAAILSVELLYCKGLLTREETKDLRQKLQSLGEM